ncbi:inositol monophosphatase [Legionella spiritensis]|nr:inositol monophosphatase [Legionella spiritensis]
MRCIGCMITIRRLKRVSEQNSFGVANPLQQELDLAIALCREAGSVAQEIRSKGYDVREKENHHGPVTEADLAANTLLLQGIARFFGNDTIVSEEAPVVGAVDARHRVWFLDPIDGTREFIAGREDWSVMVGLAIQGRPRLGVVFQPDTDCLYFAVHGCGAFRVVSGETTRLKVRVVTDIEKAILIQSHSHWSQEVEEFAGKLGITQTIKYGSLGLKLALIAAGKADLYCNFSRRCHLWDLCGPEMILSEAGGRVLSVSGNDMLYPAHDPVIRERFLAAHADLSAQLVSQPF